MMRFGGPRGLCAAMIVLLALSGCTDGPSSVRSVVLSYSGEESGDHQQTLECDADGAISGVGDVRDGQVDVIVRDNRGEAMWEHTYDGRISFDGSKISGAAGTWTIRAERSGDDPLGDPFDGQYTFTLAC